MDKKRFIKIILIILTILLSNMLIIKYCNLSNNNITLSYKVLSDKQDKYQVFYGKDDEWSEENSQKINYEEAKKEQTIIFSIPSKTQKIRLDFGSQPSQIEVYDIKLGSVGKTVEITDKLLSYESKNQIDVYGKENDNFMLKTNGSDPYICISIDSGIMSSLNETYYKINLILKIFICIIIDLVILVFAKRAKSIMSLIFEIKNNRTLIWNLSRNDFKTKYAGSYLGITWAFIQPIVTILVYWFVFQFGLKAGSPMPNVPFVVWLVSGLIPWFFFQEALLSATNCMMEYSYLVKKVLFKISILPIVKIISALFVHLVFVVFLFFVAGIYGFYPTAHSIQIIYYSFCTFCITLAFSYATSAIIVFFKDLGQIISILLQIGMWMTPIMWSYTIIPTRFQWLVKLNPMYYIVEGYRDTFINHVWFYQRYFQTIYFWFITLGLFMIGTVIFKRLKPHFADVL